MKDKIKKKPGGLNDREKKLVEEFCKFAKLADNSLAELPNIQTGLDLYLDGPNFKADIKHWRWDPIDDFSMVTPELLVYILMAAQKFFVKNHYDTLKDIKDIVEEYTNESHKTAEQTAYMYSLLDKVLGEEEGWYCL